MFYEIKIKISYPKLLIHPKTAKGVVIDSSDHGACRGDMSLCRLSSRLDASRVCFIFYDRKGENAKAHTLRRTLWVLLLDILLLPLHKSPFTHEMLRHVTNDQSVQSGLLSRSEILNLGDKITIGSTRTRKRRTPAKIWRLPHKRFLLFKQRSRCRSSTII